MKKFFYFAKYVLMYAIYLFVWIYTIIYEYVLYDIGLLSCFEDLYGKWFLYIILLITLISLLSPLYLRVKVNREWRVFLISIIIFLCYIFSFQGIYNATISQFEKFSTKKWMDYPNQRYLMVDDLKTNFSISGKTYEQAIELLGVPDKKDDSNLIYTYEYGFIEVKIQNDIIETIEVTNYY